MTNAHDFSFTAIEGGPLKLKDFSGKAVLLVNTASACGLTPQFKGLQALWAAKRDAGLIVLGVPSNDFGAQEPLTEEKVVEFCEVRYGVDFPLTTKTHVVGTDAHPLYKWIAGTLGEAAAPRWNFHKYLIGKDGALLGTFGSRTEPDDAAMGDAINAALK